VAVEAPEGEGDEEELGGFDGAAGAAGAGSSAGSLSRCGQGYRGAHLGDVVLGRWCGPVEESVAVRRKRVAGAGRVGELEL
jgi:hypothetical protein